MPPVKLRDTDITAFKGLNNRTDPMRLGLAWQTVAQNVNINSDGQIERREGYDLFRAGTITGAYNMRDFTRMYYVSGTALFDGNGVQLASGLDNTRRMHWCEINQQVHFNNGVDDGIILYDGTVIPWSWTIPAAPTLAAVSGSLPAGQYRVVCTQVLADGRETGPSDEVLITLTEGQALQVSAIPMLAGGRTRTYIAPANSQVFQLARESGSETAFVWDASPDQLGVECPTMGCDPLPAGVGVVQMWGGRAWAALYDQTRGVSYLFPSKPLGFHLFDLEDYLVVSGDVQMLAPHEAGLVVGTSTSLGYIRPDGGLTAGPNYGVVPGWCWAYDEDDSILIWTARGVCRALPFKNLTEEHVSVPPGVQAGAAVISTGGQRRFVVSLHDGGTAFNQR